MVNILKFIFLIFFVALSFSFSKGVGDGKMALVRKNYASIIKDEVRFDENNTYITLNNNLVEEYYNKKFTNDNSDLNEEIEILSVICLEDLNKIILKNQDVNNSNAINEVTQAMIWKDKFQIKIDSYNKEVENRRDSIIRLRKEYESKCYNDNSKYYNSLNSAQKEKYNEDKKKFESLINPTELINGVGLQTKEDLNDVLSDYVIKKENNKFTYQFANKTIEMTYNDEHDNILVQASFILDYNEIEKYIAKINQNNEFKLIKKSSIPNIKNKLIKNELLIYKSKTNTSCEIFYDINYAEVRIINFK